MVSHCESCITVKKMKLSDSETCKFVSLYREHECLWNVDSAAYKNKNLKRKALDTMTEAISSEIGLQDWTPELVKAKIKSLRGTYNIESRKIRASERSGIGAAEVYVPNLRWFHIMDEFMNVVKEKRNTTDNLNLSQLLRKQMLKGMVWRSSLHQHQRVLLTFLQCRLLSLNEAEPHLGKEKRGIGTCFK
ncbi:uncharacterized protein LOC129976068 [Argiope bruennichi]|uniref:uncharacterized protein LOC129976068 n=1 Tax=Argiope bruennichi TaxID=94029 RepID=UPI0024949D34|nr:uncharacterized protein LOC129976068 [Argiope bruennichi]XP_055945413.1 uncharacterized protein LOC129976068 [Argiope bruennichi]XP_055945414.1 uncharacterized protein LOC129976068 [Argiope bruennichi]